MGHTYSQLLIHVIFSTKDRRAQIDPTWRRDLFAYMGGIARREFGAIRCVNGTGNHIHLLLSLNADTALARAMNKLKSLSSRWVHDNIPSASAFAWQGGYAAFTVSRSREQEVQSYITRQEEHHRTRSFAEEYVAFLERHAIEYDPRFVLG